MEPSIAPATMLRRKANDSTAEVIRKTKHCIERSRDGGPYIGSGGKSGLVLVYDRVVSLSCSTDL
jgi:hypothetical protein